MTDDERIFRGNEAARLLSEPLLVEAFEEIEAAAIEAMVNAKPDQDEFRRHMADRVRAIRELRDAIGSVITTGRQVAARRPG